MTNEQQRGQAQPQAPALPQAPRPTADLAKKGAMAAIGGVFSGAVRAVVAHLLADGE
ncbi:hypothetical protein [Streptomyces sp. NPDC047829]|uniref:hypothetical protein n=1 Tax=Streptomyces sp. NPDC047829 TaxID=3154609 RepID=UPI0033F1F11F